MSQPCLASLFLQLQGSAEVDFCAKVAMFEGCEDFDMAILGGFLAGGIVGEGGLFEVEVFEVHEAVLVGFETDEARLFS